MAANHTRTPLGMGIPPRPVLQKLGMPQAGTLA